MMGFCKKTELSKGFHAPFLCWVCSTFSHENVLYCAMTLKRLFKLELFRELVGFHIWRMRHCIGILSTWTPLTSKLLYTIYLQVPWSISVLNMFNISHECPVLCYEFKRMDVFVPYETKHCIDLLNTNLLLHYTSNFYMRSSYESLLPLMVCANGVNVGHFCPFDIFYPFLYIKIKDQCVPSHLTGKNSLKHTFIAHSESNTRQKFILTSENFTSATFHFIKIKYNYWTI